MLQVSMTASLPSSILLLQLIKNMKQSLMKQTATAIKSAQSHLAKSQQPVQRLTSSTTKSRPENEEDATYTSTGIHMHSGPSTNTVVATNTRMLPVQITVISSVRSIACDLSGTFFRPEDYASYLQLLRGQAEYAENLEDFQVKLTPCTLDHAS